jgi:subtilisin family serine protease
MKKTLMFLTLFLVSQLGSAAWIDPVLRPLLSQTENAKSNRMITVIASLKSAMPAPEVRFDRFSHATVERYMIENNKRALNSLSSLFYKFNTESTKFSAKPNWLTNSVILRIPANKLKEFANHPSIQAIHANHKVWLVSYKKEQTYKTLNDQDYTYGMEKIGIPDVRKNYPELLGTNVPVGILDTGIDAEHEEFKGRSIIFKDFIDGETKPYDDNGHGTHVAGTIGGNSKIGAAPQVRFIIGKVFTSGGSASTSDILDAMQWIADPDGNPDTKDFPVLVSNSWGGGSPSKDKDPANEVFCKAVDAWLKLGIAPIFANGNSGPYKETVNLPAACPGTIAVGATDENDSIASFSSRGNAVWKTGSLLKPLVSAPGVRVLSAKAGGGYVKYSGTSMATPHVSGIAALLYQKAPNLTVEELSNILVKGALDLGTQGPDPDYGNGRVNIFESLKSLGVF